MTKKYEYNKLVRDKIPEIIKNKGKEVKYEILEEKEYINKLNEKLQEELNEYLDDSNVEELADLVEVVYAILKNKNVSIEEFEKIRIDKAVNRGVFNEKYLLTEVLE